MSSSPGSTSSTPSRKPALRRPYSIPKDNPDTTITSPSEGQTQPADSTVVNKGRAILGGSQSTSQTGVNNVSKNDLVLNSVLSPYAAEFVPRQSVSQSNQAPAENYWSTGDSHDENFSTLNTTEWDEQDHPQLQNDPIYQTEKAVLSLISMPGGFNDIMTPLTKVLSSQVSNRDILEQLISIIFENAILESNFHYSGARMCSYLCTHLQLPPNMETFRQCLMKRCHQEHQQRDTLIADPTTEARVIGFTLFMAELFLQLKVNDKPVVILAGGVRQLLLTLLTKHTDSNIRSTVQVLKLTGAALEDTEREKNPQCPELDKIFQRLREETVEDRVSKSVKTQLLNVIELRASNWGRVETSLPSPTAQSPVGTKLTPFQQMEPVFYNNVGQVISREEAGFADDDSEYNYWQNAEPGGFAEPGGYASDQWDDSSEMDEEMIAAYEEFCRQ